MEGTPRHKGTAAARFSRLIMLLGVGALVAAAALFGLTYSGVLDDGGGYSGPDTATGFDRPGPTAAGPTAVPTASAAAVAPPSEAPIARIVIPNANVDAPISVKGIDGNGAMDVPDGPWDVAWYDFTSRPGFGSNAVFSGHLDYIDVGPAVFWGLKDLAQGDVIDVRLEDGTVYTYRVSAMETIDAATADVGGIVGATEQEIVTLITCAGTFNQATGQYDQRLIVRAERVTDGAAAVAPQ